MLMCVQVHIHVYVFMHVDIVMIKDTSVEAHWTVSACLFIHVRHCCCNSGAALQLKSAM
jgi:hypothetical protein